MILSSVLDELINLKFKSGEGRLEGRPISGIRKTLQDGSIDAAWVRSNVSIGRVGATKQSADMRLLRWYPRWLIPTQRLADVGWVSLYPWYSVMWCEGVDLLIWDRNSGNQCDDHIVDHLTWNGCAGDCWVGNHVDAYAFI